MNNSSYRAFRVFAILGLIFLLVGFALVGSSLYSVLTGSFHVGSSSFVFLLSGAPILIIGIVYSLIGFIAVIRRRKMMINNENIRVSTSSSIEQRALRCPYCGFENKPRANKCQSCGQKL